MIKGVAPTACVRSVRIRRGSVGDWNRQSRELAGDNGFHPSWGVVCGDPAIVQDGAGDRDQRNDCHRQEDQHVSHRSRRNI
jgi:hypothetical protein